MLRVILVASAALTILSAHAADATTYYGEEVIGSLTADYSISTDGAIGNIMSSDITAFQINLVEPNDSVSFDNTDGGFFNIYTPSGVTASSSQLTFNFDNSNVTALVFGTYTGNTASFGFDTGSIYINSGSGVGAVLVPSSNPNGDVFFKSESGTQVIASVISPVPESGTWALMLAGFAFAGGALRFARRNISGLADA
jgi:hypothetical protein